MAATKPTKELSKGNPLVPKAGNKLDELLAKHVPARVASIAPTHENITPVLFRTFNLPDQYRVTLVTLALSEKYVYDPAGPIWDYLNPQLLKSEDNVAGIHIPGATVEEGKVYQGDLVFIIALKENHDDRVAMKNDAWNARVNILLGSGEDGEEVTSDVKVTDGAHGSYQRTSQKGTEVAIAASDLLEE
jgi:hypothetical protein